MSFLGTLGALRADIAERFISGNIGVAAGNSQSESECASPLERSDPPLLIRVGDFRKIIWGERITVYLNNFAKILRRRRRAGF